MKPPTILIVKTCPETKAGQVEPYRFESCCVKCGGELVEPNGKTKKTDAFEVTKTGEPNKGKVVFLCRPCADGARNHYYGGKR